MKEFTVSRNDSELWDLHRDAQKDLLRHNEKLKEALNDNLFDLITGLDIIGVDPFLKRNIRIPRKFLELPRFIFEEKKQSHIGQGSGDSKIGDLIAGQTKEGKGLHGKGGTEPGKDFYNIEIDMQTFMQWICPEFNLPNLKPRRRESLQTTNLTWDDVRKRKTFTNLDIKRTFLEAMKRQALQTGKPMPVKLKEEDLRVRTWKIESKQDNNAVIFLIGDRSSSIGEQELNLQKVYFWWIANAIRHHYGSAVIKYITFHTEAQEREEKDFWMLDSSGGTRLSCAIELVKEIIKKEFEPADWNVYVYFASDGDGQGVQDSQLTTDLIREMIKIGINQFGYLEHRNYAGYRSYFWSHLEDTLTEFKDKQLTMHSASNLEGVKMAIKRVFGLGASKDDFQTNY